MSFKYDAYLEKHIRYVNTAHEWFLSHMRDEISDILLNASLMNVIESPHDMSKRSEDEYSAYDTHFYGNRTEESEKAYQYAWLHHLHNNPHHWQHWVLINDDDDHNPIALDMPDKYIYEMLCDWWSFSWASHFEKVKELPVEEYNKTIGLDEIFTWYDDHKDRMILSDNTRQKVERILGILKVKLETM